MRIAEVIGKVTLSTWHPSLRGARWAVAVPLALEALSDRTRGRGEPLVVYDELNADAGCLIALSESAEASAPFYPDQKPIDAYNAAILDHVHVELPTVGI
ncbi:MAG: carbon dioxide concentrating mechanism protein CcmL [Planctomycetes bacterium]|nr:carbon dioxide concentrating mechanism protein CcmL [Planctomycetota bacterium]